MEPLSDVRVERDRVIATVDLPGARASDVRLRIGEREILVEARAEISGLETTYRKLLRLPVSVDPEGARARFRRGILIVEAPLRSGGYREIPVE